MMLLLIQVAFSQMLWFMIRPFHGNYSFMDD